MIKELDWQFLKDTVDELDVNYPWEWIDSFNDIYEDMIIQALNNLWIEWDAFDLIIERIYYNYLDTRIDLWVEDFLEKHPVYKDKKEELENILY